MLEYHSCLCLLLPVIGSFSTDTWSSSDSSAKPQNTVSGAILIPHSFFTRPLLSCSYFCLLCSFKVVLLFDTHQLCLFKKSCPHIVYFYSGFPFTVRGRLNKCFLLKIITVFKEIIPGSQCLTFLPTIFLMFPRLSSFYMSCFCNKTSWGKNSI